MNTGWIIGYVIGGVVVVAVVALVVPIIMLARSIGRQAPRINSSLTDAVRHTSPLRDLSVTIDHAREIVAGLSRGRARLGG
jgi:hypothetical protein